jgi:hypothetical protein
MTTQTIKIREKGRPPYTGPEKRRNVSDSLEASASRCRQLISHRNHDGCSCAGALPFAIDSAYSVGP